MTAYWSLMHKEAGKLVLFFDFDNTITLSDVLDTVIERYSITAEWREWERAWQAGRISTQECLRRQIGNLRVAPDELLRFVSTSPVDPAFASIVSWADTHEVELEIVSDNFSLVIREILHGNGLSPQLRIFGNELTFSHDRPQAVFPFQDPACARCAHCKAQRLRRYPRRRRIFVGDGLTDICPAQVAEVVFAKDSLADELTRRGIDFRHFTSLENVLEFLQKGG